MMSVIEQLLAKTEECSGMCSSHRKRSVIEYWPTGQRDHQSWCCGRPKMAI